MFKVLAIICILVFSPRSFACSVVGGLPKLDWMYENSNFVFFGKVCSRDNNFWKTALSLVEKLKCAQLLCCIALIFLMSIDDVYPMKIRHDVDDQNYLNLGEKYSQSVAYLGANRCASTLIDRYWILTAAHCVKGAERAILSVLHTDRRYRVGSITIHPEYKKSKHDIALIQLTEPVKGGKPAKLYQQEDELGKSVVFVGRGTFGNGQVGNITEDGKQRGATNTIIGASEHWIEFMFNEPGEATALEGISGGGDSGGPAFITVDSELHVAGVSSYQDPREQKPGHYGVGEYYTRVSSYADWINEVIQNAEPHISRLPEHPLVDAIRNNDEIEFRQAITINVFEKSDVINEAFFQTLSLNRISMAKELINRGANIRSVEINQLSLFELALLGGYEEYAKMLLVDFKHLKNIHREESRALPLLVSDIDDEPEALEAVKILINQGANVNAQTDKGETALILAGWRTSNLELVRQLVKAGADVNISNINGDTPLIDAAYLGKNEILSFLLESGANINLKNKAGHSALGQKQPDYTDLDY